MANMFARGLVKGSLLHERFLESPPYDLNKMKARAEGILRVVESRQQIAKITVSQNISRIRKTRKNDRRTNSKERTTRPTKKEPREKRKISEYLGNPTKWFKSKDDDFNCIFTIP